MKFLSQFDEFGENMGFPKMQDYFQKEPYPGKEKIVEYLKNGTKTFAGLGILKDVYTGEQIPIEQCGMTDGEYSWISDLYYYVEQYNLKLPEEFNEKVLKS